MDRITDFKQLSKFKILQKTHHLSPPHPKKKKNTNIYLTIGKLMGKIVLVYENLLIYISDIMQSKMCK